MYLMGIDIGTTTISIVLLDGESGTLTGKKTVEHCAFCRGEWPESRIQDPAKIWRLTRCAVQELTETYGRPYGIGLTGQMHGMLYVDVLGEAVSPLYTWQDGCGNLPLKNGRTSAEFLKEHAGYAASGYGITTHYYLQQNNRIPKEAVKMTTISDYIAMKLTGSQEPVIAADMAAGWGCFDLQKHEFCMDALRAAGVDISYLPRTCKEHGIVGRTAQGVPVICSLGDNQVSVIGSVQSLEDSVLINVGTGSQVSMGSSKYVQCGGNIELRPCLSGHYIMVGAGLCGGRAYAMLEQFYREASGVSSANLYDRMLCQAQKFLEEYGKDRAWKIHTAFSGTRENPRECGSMGEIRAENFHPGAMTAGMLLGILEELHQYYKEMCKVTGRHAVHLVGSGNGLRKNMLMRRLAEEMFGLPLKVTACEEEAACGAALCAMTAVGAAASIEDAQRKIVYITD